MIKKIALENWKSHQKTELHFSKGTNVLVGISGSGKSSAMDALCFSLFGSFPYANTRTIKLEEVITSKPLQKNYAKITTHFEYNQKNYSVERTINLKGLNEAKLFQENKLIAGPKTTEVTKRIEEILETNYELFSRAVYTEQNEADYFLKLNNAQRKEKIDELLMLKKYETVRQNAVSIQNKLKKEAEIKKTWIAEQGKKKLEEELFRLKKRILEKQEKKKELQTQKKETQQIETTLQEKIKKFEQKYEEFKKIKEKTIQIHAQIDTLKKQQKLTKPELDKETQNTILEKQKNTEDKLLWQKKTEQTQKETDMLSGKTAHLIQEKTFTEQQAHKTLNYLNELENSKAICPICRRNLEDHTKKQIIQETLKEKNELQQKIQEIQTKTTITEKELETAKKNLHEKQHQLLLFEKKEIELNNIIEKYAEQKKIHEQLILLEQEKENALKQLKNNDFDEKEFEEQKNNLAKTHEKIFSIQKEIVALQELENEIQTSIFRTQTNIEEKNKLEKETRQILIAVEKTNLFIEALKATQTELRNHLISTINEALQNIWSQIYPYEDISSCKIDITPDGNYDIRVLEKNNEWKKIEGILSGGERSCVALSIRIAISLVLAQNLGWLILDEPTHNLDKNTVKKLSNFLKNNLPQLINQVFIITHEKEMENAASSTLYFLDREKSQDTPTKAIIQEL